MVYCKLGNFVRIFFINLLFFMNESGSLKPACIFVTLQNFKYQT